MLGAGGNNFVWNGPTSELQLPRTLVIGNLKLDGTTNEFSSISGAINIRPAAGQNVNFILSGAGIVTGLTDVVIDDIFISNNVITTTAGNLVLTSVTGLVEFPSSVDINGGSIDNTAIGAVIPNSGIFTTLESGRLDLVGGGPTLTFQGGTGTNVIEIPPIQLLALRVTDNIIDIITIDTLNGNVNIDGDLNVTGTVFGATAISGISTPGNMTVESTGVGTIAQIRTTNTSGISRVRALGAGGKVEILSINVGGFIQISSNTATTISTSGTSFDAITIRVNNAVGGIFITTTNLRLSPLQTGVGLEFLVREGITFNTLRATTVRPIPFGIAVGPTSTSGETRIFNSSIEIGLGRTVDRPSIIDFHFKKPADIVFTD